MDPDETASRAVMRVRTVVLAVTLAVAVAVALAATAGVFAGVLLSRDGYADASAEAGFARDMSSHHAQAVELGMLAHARSADADVRTLGGDIALTQHGQIGIMQTWLRDWNLSPTGEQPRMAWMGHDNHASDGLMPGMATTADLARLRLATSRDFDVLWAHPERPTTKRREAAVSRPDKLVVWFYPAAAKKSE